MDAESLAGGASSPGLAARRVTARLRDWFQERVDPGAEADPRAPRERRGGAGLAAGGATSGGLSEIA